MCIDYQEIEKKLQYTFKNQDLLKQALTHKTFAFEADTPIEYNERLEFLGDSVLNFVIAKYVFNQNQYLSEGELTRRRAQLVNNKLLSSIANDLQIGKYLRLGKGEIQQKGAENKKNLANTLEAVLGAIYIDSDITTTESIIYTILQLKK